MNFYERTNSAGSGLKRASYALSVAAVLLIPTGCQQTPTPKPPAPPPTKFSGGIGGNLIGAIVNPVGPTNWCYAIESFDKQFTNGPGITGAAPYPGNPNGHPPSGFLTNVQVSASGCTATISTAGWSINAGSSFVFNTGTNYGTSLVEFCIQCDKPNGEISIVVTDKNGNQSTISPIAGPK
jgi:hypothetical protein